MEAVKHQDRVESSTGGQGTRMSSSRISFIVAMGLMAFYVVWGITKMIL